jgi:hypothetical protein
MDRPSSRLVVLGAAVFVVGAGLLFVGITSRGDDAAPPAAAEPPAASAPDEAGSTVSVQGATEVPVIPIPNRHEAVAVQIPFVAAGAGYVRAGDTINIYAAVKGSAAPPFAKLVLRDVEVLDVRGEEGGDPIFLVALKTPEVERPVFVASFESLWASLATEENNAGSSVGATYTQIR